MTAVKKSPASVRPNGSHKTSSFLPVPAAQKVSIDKLRPFIAELEVPFPPALIEWRVMNTSDDGRRGLIAPYADPRAYTDRLNELFTPAGWTRKYMVTTSPNFERSSDKKLVAKIFVTCDLTIHGIGSHSATGEEWTDNEHAGTGAEAQAFKRACSCFGLGRYLYNFTGIWVDVDDRQRPLETPQLTGWATPEGWRQGLRPSEEDLSTATPKMSRQEPRRRQAKNPMPSPEQQELVKQIKSLAEPLGRHLYRGILKTEARVWDPALIQNMAVMETVLASMQAAQGALSRLEQLTANAGADRLKAILASCKLKSLDRLDNLETLRRLVVALEKEVEHVA